MESKNKVHEYWKNPDEKNDPINYFNGNKRTNFIKQKIIKIVDDRSKILELGCNVGRNLNGLFESGYCNLYGIEINETAVELSKARYKSMNKCAKINVGAIEDEILKIEDDYFDLVFTLAVLEHIHTDSEEIIFKNILRICKKYLITVEDEHKKSERHCPRKYNEVFSNYGFDEIEFAQCGPKTVGLSKSYFYRLFKKR